MANSRIDEHYLSDEQRQSRRKSRIEEMRRRKKRQELIRKYAIYIAVAAVVCVAGIFIGIRALISSHISNDYADVQQIDADMIDNETADAVSEESTAAAETEAADISLAHFGVFAKAADAADRQIADFKENHVSPLGGLINMFPPLSASATDSTESFSADIISENGVLIDVADGTIIAQRDSRARIFPASMTKILTVLVAAEHVENLDDTFTVTLDITDYSFVHDCSNAGFAADETVTVRDLFYGTVLPSGADAAMGLAVYVAGSHEAFVDMMNAKLDELGIAETTHFTNCVGIYDEQHYSTVYDMAVIMKAAADNSFCREVLSAHIYTTSSTAQHPDGIELSNWFLRRIEDKDTHGEVLCAKTGYITQSGSCAASLAADADGKEYICVTAKSTSSWRCIYDQVALFERYL